MFSTGYVLVPRAQLHSNDTWRQQHFEMVLGAILRIVPVVCVAKSSFDDLYDPGCPRGVLSICLAIVRRERWFASDSLDGLV